jgi:hypothetical protein
MEVTSPAHDLEAAGELRGEVLGLAGAASVSEEEDRAAGGQAFGHLEGRPGDRPGQRRRRAPAQLGAAQKRASDEVSVTPGHRPPPP